MGLDASTSCTGICIFNDKKLIYYNKIKPKNNTDFRHNACDIVEQVLEVAEKYKPNIIYMEDVPTFVRKGGRGGNILKPMVSLGSVQGIFYYVLCHKHGFKIEYVGVAEWRQKLGFLKGEKGDRSRDKQKAKAVTYVNDIFGLNLHYVEGKKSVKDDDDIAEAICIVMSVI